MFEAQRNYHHKIGWFSLEWDWTDAACRREGPFVTRPGDQQAVQYATRAEAQAVLDAHVAACSTEDARREAVAYGGEPFAPDDYRVRECV